MLLRFSMNQKPTIYDVAKAAGVSLSAVSFVLNGKADKYRISKATQSRISLAISQLAFEPTQAARDITQGKSRYAYQKKTEYPIPTAAPLLAAEPTPAPFAIAPQEPSLMPVSVTEEVAQPSAPALQEAVEALPQESPLPADASQASASGEITTATTEAAPTAPVEPTKPIVTEFTLELMPDVSEPAPAHPVEQPPRTQTAQKRGPKRPTQQLELNFGF